MGRRRRRWLQGSKVGWKNTRLGSKRGRTGVAMPTNYHFRLHAPQKGSRTLSSAYLTPPLVSWYGFFSVARPLESGATPEFFPPRAREDLYLFPFVVFKAPSPLPSPPLLSLSAHPMNPHSLFLRRVRLATTFCRRFFASLLSLRMVGTATSLSTPCQLVVDGVGVGDATPETPCPRPGFQGFQLLG